MTWAINYVKQPIINKVIRMCKGCRTHENMKSHLADIQKAKYTPICNRKILSAKGICPCSTCLIKMICTIKCEKFNTYINSERSDLK